MVQIQQRVLICVATAALFAPGAGARKFYDDDPIWKEPAPVKVQKAARRKINEYYDFFQNTFFEPDKPKGPEHPGESQAVNTLGEVPDSAWYQNRHGVKPMSLDDLRRGPDHDNAPSMQGPWTVLSGKNEGITPGLFMQDSAGRKYYLKFDPISNPELASAADVIGSKFFYALGYNVPENYIVNFDRKRLIVGPRSKIRTKDGNDRQMTQRDIDDVMVKVPKNRDGQYRGLASLVIKGDILGPFRYYGTRSDDPNDVVPHDCRRDLRGLYVFAAWLNHTDSKSINSLDSIVDEGPLRYIRHYLIDFGAILGSDSFEAKSPRAGHEYLFDFKPAAIQFLTFGLVIPHWALLRYPHIPAVGRFSADDFDPERWKNNYPNPAFDNRLPDDCFWAAKKVMQFTDEEIRAMVETGRFSDEHATDWITRALIARRDKIGRAFFQRVLPLDNFRAEGGRLAFENLAAKYHLETEPQYTIQWSRFDNENSRKAPIDGETGLTLPHDADGQYLAADIRGSDPRKTVTVYLRRKGADTQVVGIDRSW